MAREKTPSIKKKKKDYESVASFSEIPSVAISVNSVYVWFRRGSEKAREKAFELADLQG